VEPTAEDSKGDSDNAAKEEPAEPKFGQISEVKLPEFPHTCRLYIPAAKHIARTPAALLWLHPPGESKPDVVIDQWKSICDRDGILLIVPSAADSNRWERTEIEYLRRIAERVIAEFKVDERRIVVYGQGGGGAMAWLVGLSSRDLFRGIATSAAALPRQIAVPANEPAQRLAILAAIPTTGAMAAQIGEGLENLHDAGYTVTTLTAVETTGKLTNRQREEIARWLDTLDRF
jgi:poly(3-hydroxybutyrate) depolymerase